MLEWPNKLIVLAVEPARFFKQTDFSQLGVRVSQVNISTRIERLLTRLGFLTM